MEENRSSFTLKDVIFNLLFILLFVFILLWLFPNKAFLNGNNKVNKNNANQTFNENIRTMKEAAISYFTTPRLPQKVGSSVDLTLKQMIDKKIILSLVDSNKEICDEGKSYVEITKENEEYVLKVSLSCSDMSDYILVHLGCYDYCDGDVCEKKEVINYRYQYQLVTPCKWSDFGGWSNWQTAYVASSATRKVETKVETDRVNANTDYYCPEGYAYNEATKKCYKSVSSTDNKDAEEIITLSCEAGYTYDNNTKKCIKESTTTVSVAAKERPTTYNCNAYSGYTLSGNKCIKTISSTDTKNATAVTSYSCKNGTLNKDGKTCNVPSTRWDTFNATKTCSTKITTDCSTGSCIDVPVTSCKYSCPNGYQRTGTTCYGTTYITLTENAVKKVTYNCNSYDGYTLNGTTCTKSTSSVDTKNATENKKTYYCEDASYTLNGTTCTKQQVKVETKEPISTTTYSCAKYGNDYSLNNKTCSKTVTNSENVDLLSRLVCPSGYTLNGTVCSKNIIYYRYAEKSCNGGSIDYKWSESEKDESLLSKGYKLTGLKEILKNK